MTGFDTITPAGAGTAFLKMKKAGTNVSLMRDASRRIWVGMAKEAAGDAGPTSSTIFVIRARKP